MNSSFSLPIRLLSIRASILLLAAFAPSLASGVAKTPEWLRQPLNESVEHLSTDADAVLLVNDETIVISSDGIIEHQNRQAVRILTKSGADKAVGRIFYNAKADKVSEVRAWLILPRGEIREYSDKDFVRSENVDYGTLFTEYWSRSLDESNAAVPGSVFAYTYKLREQTIFPQMIWTTRFSVPVLRSTITITVPKDWRVTATPVNKPEFSAKVTGSTYRWEATSQPARKDENLSERGAEDSYVGINIYPSERDKKRARLTTFDDWQSIAMFQASLNDAQARPDEAIRAKVASLTSDCDSQWKRIQAVCRYAQAVNYVSIGTNLSKGGGYQPFPAATVFARNYGDCKDKTALLRAMLSCVGVESCSVACLSDTKKVVNQEWPSTTSFNHCIVAMKPPEGVETTALVTHPDLGPLLIFDPTNTHVPVGYISDTLSDTYFLACSGECKTLALFPSKNTVRQYDMVASLDATGRLTGSFSELDKGGSATSERSTYRAMSQSDYARALAEFLRQQTRETKLLEWKVKDDYDTNEFHLDLTFDAPGYARPIGAKKLLFKSFIDRTYSYVPEEAQDGKRETPFVVPETEQVRNSKITLPDGFTVDELPADLSLKEEFGSIELHSSVEGNVVNVHLTLRLQNKRMPPEAYERLRAFYKARNKALQSTIVIRRI